MADSNKDFKKSFLRVTRDRRETSIKHMTEVLATYDEKTYKGIKQYEDLKANLEWAKENIDEPQSDKEEESE